MTSRASIRSSVGLVDADDAQVDVGRGEPLLPQVRVLGHVDEQLLVGAEAWRCPPATNRIWSTASATSPLRTLMTVDSCAPAAQDARSGEGRCRRRRERAGSPTSRARGSAAIATASMSRCRSLTVSSAAAGPEPSPRPRGAGTGCGRARRRWPAPRLAAAVMPGDDGAEQVHQGRGERLRLVRHVEEVVSQLRGPHVRSVEGHAPRGRVEVPGEQLEHLVRLGSGGGHDPDDRAGREQRGRRGQGDARGEGRR